MHSHVVICPLYIYRLLHAHTHTYTSMHILCTLMRIDIHTDTYTHVHIYVYTCTYTLIPMRAYIWIYLYTHVYRYSRGAQSCVLLRLMSWRWMLCTHTGVIRLPSGKLLNSWLQDCGMYTMHSTRKGLVCSVCKAAACGYGIYRFLLCTLWRKGFKRSVFHSVGDGCRIVGCMLCTLEQNNVE